MLFENFQSIENTRLPQRTSFDLCFRENSTARFLFQLQHALRSTVTLKNVLVVFVSYQSLDYCYIRDELKKLFNEVAHEVAKITRRTCLRSPVGCTSGRVITTLGKVIIERKREERGLVGRNVKKGEIGRSVSTPDILPGGSGARDSHRHARHAECVFILLLLLLLLLLI